MTRSVRLCEPRLPQELQEFVVRPPGDVVTWAGRIETNPFSTRLRDEALATREGADATLVRRVAHEHGAMPTVEDEQAAGRCRRNARAANRRDDVLQ